MTEWKKIWVTEVYGDKLTVTENASGFYYDWSFDYNGSHYGTCTTLEAAQNACEARYREVAHMVADTVVELETLILEGKN